MKVSYTAGDHALDVFAAHDRALLRDVLAVDQHNIDVAFPTSDFVISVAKGVFEEKAHFL